MSPYLTLDGVSYSLPNGNSLFTNLHAQFGPQRVGLVGRNGAGKSVLAKILAKRLQPTAGRVTQNGLVYYLAQAPKITAHDDVASLAGVGPALAALRRIEQGSTEQSDFELLADRWDIRQRLQMELERHGLEKLHAQTKVDTLSGGEQMRVALIAASMTGADMLILDEPSNHLDRASRQALIEQLQQWQKGLLLISHDRQLLEGMARIIQLNEFGLRSYGGSYTFYAQCKAQEREAAIQHLEHAKTERKRQERALRMTLERSEHKQSQGNKQARVANQAKILLDKKKERSQTSAGRLQTQYLTVCEKTEAAVKEAANKIDKTQEISLHEIPVNLGSQRRILTLDLVQLPEVRGAASTVSFSVTGHQRIAVVGPNACGKSTLLRVLAGELEPLSGHCEVLVKTALLDQHFTILDPHKSTIEQLCNANPSARESDLRTQLAHLGLHADTILAPCVLLSGGERLKAALACVLYAENPPELLLLDEPSNHLDLDSMRALEDMLNHYRGALLVVSHDDVFLGNLALDQRLEVSECGWQLQLC